MQEHNQLAVRRFLRQARDQLHSHDELAEAITRLGYPIKRSAVGHWLTGRSSGVPAWVVFALAADLDIGLDDFAFAQDRHPLMRDLAALDERLRPVEALLSRLLVAARQEGWDIQALPDSPQ